MLQRVPGCGAQGVRDRVIWLDKFVSNEELARMFECTSVFVTPFDESTPTSVRTSTSYACAQRKM